jgi:hypothetical protein
MAMDAVIRAREALEKLQYEHEAGMDLSWDRYHEIDNELDAIEHYISVEVKEDQHVRLEAAEQLENRIDELKDDLNYAKTVIGELVIGFRKECCDEE